MQPNRKYQDGSANSRRAFLRTMVTCAGGAFALPYFVPEGVLAASGVPGANERVAIGAIGVGKRASLLLDQLPEQGQIVALSDCNLSRAEAFRDKHKASWPVHQNYHALLERKDVDAVIVATREHQRVLPCIHACQAGKDIYAEKPLTLYIHEGRVLVEAVRKHGRILQVGAQQRSMEINRLACKFVREGGLGELRQIQAVNYGDAALPPKEPPPAEPLLAGLDWDMWLNQAAWRPYNITWISGPAMRCRDLAGGQMTNWGAHGIDQAQWALDADQSGPVEMWPVTGGARGAVTMRYGNGVELRFVLQKAPMGGAIFIGEKGKLEINRNKIASNPKDIAEGILKDVNLQEEEKKWSDEIALWQARWHLQNWIDCIHTRELPVSDVETGHRSITVCHLANLTRRLGRKLHWDPQHETFLDDAEANALVSWPRRKGYELPETT